MAHMTAKRRQHNARNTNVEILINRSMCCFPMNQSLQNQPLKNVYVSSEITGTAHTVAEKLN